MKYVVEVEDVHKENGVIAVRQLVKQANDDGHKVDWRWLLGLPFPLKRFYGLDVYKANKFELCSPEEFQEL
jgi:hypothetical protein